MNFFSLFNRVTNHEQHVASSLITTIQDNILGKRKCNVVDIGMNDGIYTNLAASQGCLVWGAEIQGKCINMAHEAAARNNFTHLIHFINKPVSSVVKDVTLKVDVNNCDGLYNLGRPDNCNVCPQVLNSRAYFNETFLSATVDTLFPSPFHIDFMKIDAEGHDPHVFAGAIRGKTS